MTGLTGEAPHRAERAWIDTDAVRRLREQPVPIGTKGMPPGLAGLTVGDVANSGWRVLDGQLAMPLMILKESALRSNISAMAAYCAACGVSLCPHGKTTMAPALFQRQIEAGAWGLTAATPAHLQLYRRFGVNRIFYANQLVEPAVIRWIARELEEDPSLEIFCLVDSPDAVEMLGATLSSAGAPRPIGVLVEVGLRGGRCGVRDLDLAVRVAGVADATAAVDLRGVECFEGLPLASSHDPVGEVLGFAKAVTHRLRHDSSLSEVDELIVSAGGSAHFGRVVDELSVALESPDTTRIVLRSGCYVTNDGGFYATSSPLANGYEGPYALQDAIEIWSVALSRPEASRVICSMGRRDAPEDMGLPIPTSAVVAGVGPQPLIGASVTTLSDQHGHLEVPPDLQLRPGDLVGCAVSHPCTAFDKWRLIPVVDDEYTICDVVTTHF